MMNRSMKTTKNNLILSNNLSTFPRFYDTSIFFKTLPIMPIIKNGYVIILKKMDVS